MNRKKKNHLTLLGLFLIIMGISSLEEILTILYTYYPYTWMKFLPLEFFWLFPALLFLYIVKVTNWVKSRRLYLILLPGLLEFIFGVYLYSLPIEEVIRFKTSYLYSVADVLGILFGLTVFIFSIIRINQHTKILNDQYSSIQGRDLYWLKIFILFFLISLFLSPLLLIFIKSNLVLELISSFFSLFFVLWISYHGVKQQLSVNFYSLLNKENASIKQIGKSNKREKLYADLKLKQVFSKVEALLSKEKLFLNPELNIHDIAQKTKEHSRLISSSINTIAKQNFNTYVNKFRIKRATELLLSDTSDKLNIEGIGKEAGFKTNSAFYTAFKKQHKITPLQFSKKPYSH